MIIKTTYKGKSGCNPVLLPNKMSLSHNNAGVSTDRGHVVGMSDNAPYTSDDLDKITDVQQLEITGNVVHVQ